VSPPLPPDHPQRVELNDEVHARPPEMLEAPAWVSFLALLSDQAERDRERALVAELAQRYGAAPPVAGANHYSADLGPFRLKWERHNEWTRYKVTVAGTGGDDPFAAPAIAAAPADWLAALPGRVMVATHVALLRADSSDPPDYEALSARLFAGHALVGATIGGGVATALTDFRIHGDGFGRLLVLDHGLSRRQAGRMVQRLLEIDAYRMMALLALPVARGLAPQLSRYEGELAELAAALIGAREADEPVLLDRLTRLEAEIGRRQAETDYRFSAAEAYHELVRRRIAELREERIQGLQTFHEFMERRLAPAIGTCRTAAARLESLAHRAARAGQLLSTRVDVTLERQNQAVLESVDRRAHLQLRLQETVEGLSVAAITYYVSGLIGYLAKAAKASGVSHVEPDLVTGAAIPIVALLVWFGIRRIRKAVARDAE